jgi:hypothetical protein
MDLHHLTPNKSQQRTPEVAFSSCDSAHTMRTLKFVLMRTWPNKSLAATAAPLPGLARLPFRVRRMP